MNISEFASDIHSCVTSFLSFEDVMQYSSVSRSVRDEMLEAALRDHNTFTKRNDTDGSTPLMRACRGHSVNPHKIRFMVQVGGRRIVSAQDDYGETVLHAAVRTGDLEVLKILCDSEEGQRAVSLRNSLGNTALHDAVSMDDTEAMQLLCDTAGGRRSVLLSLRNNMGHTPLHNAVERDNVEAVYLLCGLGGREVATLKTKDGETPLSLAKRNFNAEMIMLLSHIVKAIKE